MSTHEQQLGAIAAAGIDPAPVRLSPAAAERVARAGARAHCEKLLGPCSDEDFDRAWASDRENLTALWVATAGAITEQVVAELRLAGWKVVPPGAEALKGGV